MKQEGNLKNAKKVLQETPKVILDANDSNPALGTQAGKERIKEMAEKAGFTKYWQASKQASPNTILHCVQIKALNSTMVFD